MVQLNVDSTKALLYLKANRPGFLVNLVSLLAWFDLTPLL